jgi:hypothetical protein
VVVAIWRFGIMALPGLSTECVSRLSVCEQLVTRLYP